MATRKVFFDDNSTMDVYVNTVSKLFIQIGLSGGDNNPSYVVLDTEDVEELQKEISNYLEYMKYDAPKQ